MPVLTVDDLTFEVRRSPRRKTLEITVDRGGELMIAAPAETDEAAMAELRAGEAVLALHQDGREGDPAAAAAPPRSSSAARASPTWAAATGCCWCEEQEQPLKLEAGGSSSGADLGPPGP